mgnify:CR=1 FL=1
MEQQKSDDIITRQAVNQVISDYREQYKKHPLYTAVAFLFPALGNTLNYLVPPLIVAKIIDTFVAQGSVVLSEVWWYVGMFGGVWLLGELCWRIGMYSLTRLEERGLNALNVLSFQRLMERDYAFFTNNFVGSMTKKTIAFSRSFEMFTETLAFNVSSRVLPMIVAFFILSQYSFWLPLTLALWLTFGVLVALPIIHRRSRLVALRHDASSKVAGRLSDAATNALTVKSFAQEESERTTYGLCVTDFTQKFKKAWDSANLWLFAALSPLYVATNVCGLILAIFFAEKLSLSAGAIVVIFTYYASISGIFWEINLIYRNIESSVSEAAEFTQMFLQLPAITDVPKAKLLVVDTANIRFDNVTFHYADMPPGEPPLLQNFCLDIKARERVGLVGPSGGGKTTITKLLLRFIDAQSGSISIDGQDIGKVTQGSLRRAIAYVPQEPLLFHRSLFENIAYSNEHATHAEVINAATLAHAHEFINELPLGYDTLVGERGIKLSGGQRQRIAIARAILKQSRILVLDEATSALDSESEKYIQEGLWELMKDKTALVIAHRLSTIKHLDRIIVLDRGAIVQQGTHDQLIKKRGLYKTLWSLQSGEFV